MKIDEVLKLQRGLFVLDVGGETDCFSVFQVFVLISDGSHGMKALQPSLSHSFMLKVKAAAKVGCWSLVVTPMSVCEGWMVGGVCMPLGILQK